MILRLSNREFAAIMMMRRAIISVSGVQVRALNLALFILHILWSSQPRLLSTPGGQPRIYAITEFVIESWTEVRRLRCSRERLQNRARHDRFLRLDRNNASMFGFPIRGDAAKVAPQELIGGLLR